MAAPFRIVMSPDGKRLWDKLTGIPKSRTILMAALGLAITGLSDNVPQARAFIQTHLPGWTVTAANGVVFLLVMWFRMNPKQFKEATDAAAQVKAELGPIVQAAQDNVAAAGLAPEEQKQLEELLAKAQKLTTPAPTVPAPAKSITPVLREISDNAHMIGLTPEEQATLDEILAKAHKAVAEEPKS